MANYALEAFIFLTVISFFFYKWATAHFKTFTQRNIESDKPFPLVGNTLSLFTGKDSLYKILINLHDKYKAEKVYGYYNLRDPVFIVRDPELIKKIAIKDFDNFPNHSSNMSARDDEFVSSMLTMLTDQKWKDMRTTLSPVFTGNKMRQIFQLINECGSDAVSNLHDEVKPDGTELELKEFFSRYTNDVIASAAFGLKIDSYRDKGNSFFAMSRRVMKFKATAIIKLLLLTIVPQIGKIYKLKIFDQEALDYLKQTVSETMKYREKNNVVRQDMINLLMEAQKQGQTTSQTKWTDTEIIAQCLLFLFAGFETVSNMLCFTAYELMKNPEVQETLYREITEMHEELNGKQITYGGLKSMKYLNMVVSESLRKWPPAIVTDRVCSKPYTLTDAEGKIVVELKAGDNVWFSIIGSHYDEENFLEPYTFNPERFSEENKNNIKPFTYIPFGVGPRSCIANRFGLMEGKAMLYHLLLEFKFASGQKTTPDLFEAIKGFQLTPENLFWIKLVPRRTGESSI